MPSDWQLKHCIITLSLTVRQQDFWWAWVLRQDQRGRASLVVHIHYVGEAGMPVRSSDAGSAPHLLHQCYLLCCVNKIVCLCHCQAKTIKGRSERKAEYFIYEQKVGKLTSKCGNILPKMEELADVSYCMQQFHMLCCKTLKADWHIHKYTRPVITL